MNKKIIIAIFLTIIMISGTGLVLFNNNSHITVSQNSDAINSTTTNQCNVTIGASNSGLTVPLSTIGYSGSNGSSVLSSYTPSSTISNDGSTYYISGNTLIVNTTTSISNVIIPYGIEIVSGAKLTLNSVKLDEVSNGNAVNDYNSGQLAINDSLVCGDANTYSNPIVAYANYTLFYNFDDKGTIEILDGNYDTFWDKVIVADYGTISHSYFDYSNGATGLGIYAGVNNALIEYSYLDAVSGAFNDNSNLMKIEYSTISFEPTYVCTDASNKGQYSEQYVNLSYDRFTNKWGASYDGLMLFDYSDMYNDYYNFTVPQSEWTDSSVISDLVSYQYYNLSLRGQTNLNDSLYPVHMSHNEFAGWDGFDLYGTGNAYIQNNIFTLQSYITGYLVTFYTFSIGDVHQVQNSDISNNTFYFYGNLTLENEIANDRPAHGGVDYITGGENGGLASNVTISYNSFIGGLYDSYAAHAHGAYILGAYQYVNHNYFDETVSQSSGTVPQPNMALNWYQENGDANISYNKFYGLSSNSVAIALVPQSGFTSLGTVDLYANEYKGSDSQYQITNGINATRDEAYTLNAINKTNYQYLKGNGTVTMISGGVPNGYSAYSYSINNVSISTPISNIVNTTYNITIKENGLPINTTWQFTFNGVSKTLTNTSYTFNVKNGTYDLSVTSISGYNLNYPSTVTVNSNETVNVDFSLLSTTITSKNVHYYIDIIINNPKTIFYTLILNENGNITYHNLTSSNIVINVNTTDYPISINFVDLKNGYSISNPVMNYNTAGNYTLTENIISNNNINSEVNKYMPVLAIVLVFMGFMIAGAVAVKRR